jgi:sortase A
MDIGENRNITGDISKDRFFAKKINILKLFGIFLISIGILLPILIFKDVLINEFEYQRNKETPKNEVVEIKPEIITTQKEGIEFLNPKFGIYIPKISANAKVLENIDPFNQSEYDAALKDGIAHAKGSSLPNDSGNIFIFAHSATDFYKNSKYNVKFYLLTKLENNDLIYISYNNKIFQYKVEKVSIVNKNEIKYIGNYNDKKTLTLMTCWPAGIDYKRVIVTAVQQPF